MKVDDGVAMMGGVGQRGEGGGNPSHSPPGQEKVGHGVVGVAGGVVVIVVVDVEAVVVVEEVDVEGASGILIVKLFSAM